jgi:hypothetical protein
MIVGKLSSLAALFAAFALSACASAGAPGVAPASEPSFVSSVTVVQHDASAPANFADSLRDTVLKGALLYGTSGRPIALNIDLDKVHFKNPLKALVIGDNSMTTGHVAVLDQSTGAQLGTFKVQVDAERPSAAGTGASIAMFLGEAFDPTGISGMVDMAGNAASADINRGGAASAMRANFAAETLRQTFGDAKTRAAKSAKPN